MAIRAVAAEAEAPQPYYYHRRRRSSVTDSIFFVYKSKEFLSILFTKHVSRAWLCQLDRNLLSLLFYELFLAIALSKVRVFSAPQVTINNNEI